MERNTSLNNKGVLDMRKKEYCQPEIKVHSIGVALMSATSNTLPVSDETVTEDEQLSKEAPGWWADNDF
ncbi:hypothetical protein HMPREF1870_01219 [Bacteroidales bacterium KA00344]|nr:hypothetical protein HMPREF1870_01219 [Bacteroidales bacterium KA00344]